MTQTTRRIFGIGETVYDIVFKNLQPITAKAGGSVLNALVSLARSGNEVHYITEIGDDALSDVIIDFLHKNKIGQRYISRHPGAQTPLALATLDNKNNASYSFYKTLPDKKNQVIPTDLTSNDIILFGSSYAVNPNCQPFLNELLTQAKKVSALVVYDPNFRPSHLNNLDLEKTVMQNMQFSTIVRGSLEDFTGLFGVSTAQAAYDSIQKNCSQVIITDAPKAIYSFSKGGAFEIPIPPLKPLSTIGAGDNFNAGIIQAIIEMGIDAKNIEQLNQNDWCKILEYGKAFSTAVCLNTDNYVDDGFIERLPYILGTKELAYQWHAGKEPQ